MSKTQINTLLHAYETGNAVDDTKIYKNGAHMRMIKRMIVAGLLNDQHKITEKGIKMLQDNGHRVVLPTVYQTPKALEAVSGPFRLRSRGTYASGKGWTKYHGEPITNPVRAQALLAEMTARAARVYGKDTVPFTFEIV